jgi:hypothetical protein
LHSVEKIRRAPCRKRAHGKAARTLCAKKRNFGSLAPNKHLSMRSPIIDELTKKKQIWIGTQYWSHRRLILGESTYGNEPSDTLGFCQAL